MPTLFLDSGSFNHIQVSGSLVLSGSTTLQGTASFALSSSRAVTSSFTLGPVVSDGTANTLLSTTTQTIAGNKTFSGVSTFNSNVNVKGAGGAPIFAVGATSATTIRTGSAAAGINPTWAMAGNISTLSTGQYLNWDETNQWTLSRGNGTNQIIRAAWQLTNNTDTAASETSDLSFLVKPSNAAITERLRISGNGAVVVTGSLTVTTGSVVEFQVTNTGVNIGNTSTDTHTTIGTQVISGSLVFIPTASVAFNGEIVRFGAGTLTTGQLYFLSSSGTWSLANANSTGSSTGMLGLAVGSSPTTNGLLIRGFAASASYTTSTGSIVYAATSSGLMTTSSPSSSNHVVRVVGYVTTVPNTIYFDPDKTWVTLA